MSNRVCACGSPRAYFSRDGANGPWRCKPCDKTAKPMDLAQLTAPPTQLL